MELSFNYCRFQIDFLNSVIVGLRKDNLDLKDQMEKMAAAALNGNNTSEPDDFENFDGSVSQNAIKVSVTMKTPLKDMRQRLFKRNSKILDRRYL